MNNYYTLIYLNFELKENISEGEFEFAISPHKNVLECYIMTEDGMKRLIFSADPSETALFLDEYRPPKKRNVFDFFEQLEGREIQSVSLAEYDRLLSIRFDANSRLLFRLFGNHPNVLLVEEDMVVDAFKNPEKNKGEPAPQPQNPRFADEISSDMKPKNQITRLNPLLPRNLLPPLIAQHEVEKMNAREVKSFTQKITDALLNNPHPRVLKRGDFCLWSEKILDLPTEKSFDSVNEGIRFTYRNAVHLRRLQNKKERLAEFLSRSARKKQAEYEQLQQADKSLDRADRYEQYGNLLMANAHESVQPGQETIEVDNFYENNEPIEIALQEGLTIAENAGRYYEKAKSSRTSYEKARQRLPKVEKEVEDIEYLQEELKEIDRLPELEKWIKNNENKLEKYGYGTEDEGQAKSPFRKFKVGKYELWIGKNAKSNDQLTRRAHKEDIWLHARGVSGSHAVIRMGNERSYPPKKVILQAAAHAAYYSKARGMKSAPVMYTKRKYVYKPSGSEPGTVALKREKVVMVPPMKP
ncbi:MAG TPA: NFACT RNA binding domain-containing protein, partial [Balneolaceae bacterium]|nr:NFACT RNA binding domain-containing protein [Balneolaceae bacterium]